MNLAESAPPPQLAPEALPSHEKLQPSEVCITGIVSHATWGKENETPLDRVRGNEILKNLERYIKEGYTVVMVEGFNSDEFLTALNKVVTDNHAETQVHIIKETGKGYGRARRQALRAASELDGVQAIFQCEFEKPLHDQIPELMKALNNGADIAISDRQIQVYDEITGLASYGDENLAGLPPYQARSEYYFNQMTNALLRYLDIMPSSQRNIDWMGNRLWRNTLELNDIFLNEVTYSDEKYRVLLSDWPVASEGSYSGDPDRYTAPLFYPILLALKQGLSVASVPTPYNHAHYNAELPEVETGDKESDRKRDKQRTQILTELFELALSIVKTDYTNPFTVKKTESSTIQK